MSQPLRELCQQLVFTHLKITIKLSSLLVGDKYKGSMFHGGLGWAISEVHPAIYQALFNLRDNKGHTLPASCIIVPPLDGRAAYLIGDTLNFEIKLFESANQYLGEILQSLFIWQTMGLGKTHSPFEIESIDFNYQNQWLVIYQRNVQALAIPSPLSLASFLTHPFDEADKHCQIFVYTHTAIQLIRKGKALTQAPNLNDLLFFSAQRLASMIEATTQQSVPVHSWLPKVIDPLPVNQQVTEFTQNRKSAHYEDILPITGIQGYWQYSDHTDQIIWLMLAKNLHIGKKSTFGLGKIDFKIGING